VPAVLLVLYVQSLRLAPSGSFLVKAGRVKNFGRAHIKLNLASQTLLHIRNSLKHPTPLTLPLINISFVYTNTALLSRKVLLSR
jgi:hypothetical protein